MVRPRATVDVVGRLLPVVVGSSMPTMPHHARLAAHPDSSPAWRAWPAWRSGRESPSPPRCAPRHRARPRAARACLPRSGPRAAGGEARAPVRRPGRCRGGGSWATSALRPARGPTAAGSRRSLSHARARSFAGAARASTGRRAGGGRGGPCWGARRVGHRVAAGPRRRPRELLHWRLLTVAVGRLTLDLLDVNSQQRLFRVVAPARPRRRARSRPCGGV